MTLRDGPYEAYVYDDIGAVSPAEWDTLLQPGDLVGTHRFVSTCQAAAIEEARYRHAMIYRRGELVAIAPLSLFNVRLEVLASDVMRATMKPLRQVFPDVLRVPFLFCGLPVSTGQSSLRIAAGADVPSVLDLLCRVMEIVGEEWGAQIYCFKDLPTGQAARVSSLQAQGYVRAHSLPNAALPISWTSFDGYLAQMRSGYRRQARADLAVRAQEDLEWCVLDDFGAVSDAIFHLYEPVVDRAPYQLERLNPQFFVEVNRQMGADAWVLLLKKDGAPIAAALMLEAGGTLTFLFVGIDYAVNRTYHAYFNVLLEMVAEAIRRGASQLILGQTSYACKQRIGARPAPRFLYLRHRSPRLHAVLRSTVDWLFPEPVLEERRVFKHSLQPVERAPYEHPSLSLSVS